MTHARTFADLSRLYVIICVKIGQFLHSVIFSNIVWSVLDTVVDTNFLEEEQSFKREVTRGSRRGIMVWLGKCEDKSVIKVQTDKINAERRD